LRNAGCVAITDDGRPVKTAILLRRALEYAGMFGMPVIEHCEDASLKGDAVAHEGYYAASLGLRGMPGACEALGVERGVLLAELTGSSFHVAHMSARAAPRAARRALCLARSAPRGSDGFAVPCVAHVRARVAPRGAKGQRGGPACHV